jgi:hypothetical protein
MMGQERKVFRMRFLTELASFRFWVKSAFSRPLLQKLKLTSFGTYSGKVNYTKVVDNFDIFPESINTPLSDKWFRSNGL